MDFANNVPPSTRRLHRLRRRCAALKLHQGRGPERRGAADHAPNHSLAGTPARRRLFNRTARSVALTEAGERLLSEIQPIVQGIDHALESVNLFRDKPIGTLRLVVSRPSATRRLAPLLQPFMAEYPAIRLEVVVDDTTHDLVAAASTQEFRLVNG